MIHEGHWMKDQYKHTQKLEKIKVTSNCTKNQMVEINFTKIVQNINTTVDH